MSKKEWSDFSRIEQAEMIVGCKLSEWLAILDSHKQLEKIK